MAEAMTHTDHSPDGTDERVKLPNHTEDFDWEELAHLYSVNESVYGHRPADPTPNAADWANFHKDVDRMFALQGHLRRNPWSHTGKLKVLAEPGSGDWEPDVSGDGEGPLNNLQKDKEPQVNPLSMLDPHPSSPTLHNDVPQLPNHNELPEASTLSPGLSITTPTPNTSPAPVPRGGTWLQQLEAVDEKADFSGNGLMELETHHGHILRDAAFHHHSLEPILSHRILQNTETTGSQFHQQRLVPHSIEDRDDFEKDELLQAHGPLPQDLAQNDLLVHSRLHPTQAPLLNPTKGPLLDPTQTSLPNPTHLHGNTKTGHLGETVRPFQGSSMTQDSSVHLHPPLDPEGSGYNHLTA